MSVSAWGRRIGRPELSVRAMATGGHHEDTNGLNNAEPIGLALSSCGSDQSPGAAGAVRRVQRL